LNNQRPAKNRPSPYDPEDLINHLPLLSIFGGLGVVVVQPKQRGAGTYIDLVAYSRACKSFIGCLNFNSHPPNYKETAIV
jgi:hypothetical protein